MATQVHNRSKNGTPSPALHTVFPPTLLSVQQQQIDRLKARAVSSRRPVLDIIMALTLIDRRRIPLFLGSFSKSQVAL